MSTHKLDRLPRPHSLAIMGANPGTHAYGQVLASSIKMLQMCPALGFSVCTDPDDLDVRDVSLTRDRCVSRIA